MKRRKMALKFILFFATMGALYWSSVEYIVYPHLSPSGIRAGLKKKYIETKIPKDEVDYLVLGDSSAFYAINPVILSPNSYSAGQLGVSVAQSRKIFHYDEDIWKIFVPQGMMSLNDVISSFCIDYNQKCSLWQKATLVGKYVWYRLHMNSHAGSVVSYAITTQSRYPIQGFSKRIAAIIEGNNGHFAAEGQNSLNNDEFFAAYWRSFTKPVRPPKSELLALKELAADVKRYGVKLYVIQPQLYRDEKIIDLKTYNSSYINFLNSDGDLGISYIGYDQFNVILEKKYYRDFSHLNREGANTITQALVKYINSQEGAK